MTNKFEGKEFVNSSGAVAGGAESAPVYEIYALKYMGPIPPTSANDEVRPKQRMG